MTDGARRNRLAAESSPYLLQHAGNPVDWYPWGAEALSLARQEQRPIFLSIGYAACHWCHVMEHESFEDEEVAQFLNAHFVSIKVDREERPDLDAVYMAAVQALTGSGGWPLSAFLTPDLRAFYGGTYFPPERRWGRPSFLEVLQAVEQAWRERRDQVLESAEEIAEHLSSSTAGKPGDLDASSAADEALAQLRSSHDPVWGGFGAAPKFPTPSRLFFLVERAARGNGTARALLAPTLDSMAAGGMWDWVGGGFHRYSVDATWLVPHFEKMLYDNALLARTYGEAGVRLREPRWVEVARGTADYLVREMQGPEGGFYSSTDADSEGEEGRYFTWTADEVRAALDPDLAQAVIVACGLEGEANFEHGRHVLRPATDLSVAARHLGLDETSLSRALDTAREGLYRARSERLAPLLDDKRLAGWNGMAMWALAWLGGALDEPRYLEAASRSADFVLRRLLGAGGAVVRSWRDGTRSGAETLEDVAWLTAGLIELYQAKGDIAHLRAASNLVRHRLPHYQIASGVVFETPDDGERLPLRPRSALDGATPANVAVLVRSLLRLAALTGDGATADAAAQAVHAEAGEVHRFPAGAAALIGAAAELAEPSTELVVVGDPKWQSTRGLLVAARRAVVPPLVLAVAPAVPLPDGVLETVPLFQGRENVTGERALAYLCSGGACDLPIEEPAVLAGRLASPRHD